jgi:endonuclease/exonuclease/phosphatase (EEP) superfamily protein YafD
MRSGVDAGAGEAKPTVTLEVMQLRKWLRRVVGALIALVGAATLLGFLDSVAWPFEFGAIFRLQYAGLLLVLVVAAVPLRMRRAALVAAALAVVNLASVVPAPEGPAQATEVAGGVPLRVLMVNVEAGNDRYADLVRLVREMRPDVIGVTELDDTWARELTRRLPDYGERLTVPEDGAYGIGLFSRLRLEAARVERFPAGDGPPSIVVRLRPPGAEVLTLVLTHVHTPFAGSIHERHLEALAEARPRLGHRLAVCGDFNTVPWTAAFGRLVESGLADLYGGSWPGYSWPTWNPLLRLPIDNCLVTGVGVAGHRHGPDIGSDHYPLIVDLAVPRPA